jgi:hypothetical protein
MGIFVSGAGGLQPNLLAPLYALSCYSIKHAEIRFFKPKTTAKDCRAAFPHSVLGAVLVQLGFTQ